MSRRRKRQTASPVPWGRFAALGLVLVTSLALLWVCKWRPVLGVSGQHAYGYHPAPQRRSLAVLALASLPLLAGVGVALLRRAWTRRWQEWATVGLLTVGSLLLHATAALAPKALPGAEIGWTFLWTNTEGAYAHWAGSLGSLRALVSQYPHLIDARHGKIHHPQVHPPGLVLAFGWADRLYDALPGLDGAVSRAVVWALPTSSLLRDSVRTPLRHPLAVSITAAAVTILLAAATPLALYLALRTQWPTETVVTAAALSTLVPGTYLFSPGVDQAYPVVVVVLGALLLRMLTTQRIAWAFAFGLALYAAMFVHIGLALAVGIMGMAALVAWRALKPGWRVRALATKYWRPTVAMALGFLTPAFVLRLWLGYPTFRVILTCLHNNRLFNAQAKRTWGPWVAVTPLEFALSLGVALGLVCVVGWLCEAYGALRQRSLRGRVGLLLCAVAVLATLNVAGMNRGESARLWLFVTPLLALGAARLLERAAWRRRVLISLALCQWLQLILFRVILDMGRTSTFMLKDLPQQ